MRRRILVLLAVLLVAVATPITAEAQEVYAPPGSSCYGVTYDPSSLGAIRPDSPWDLASIEDDYQRCVVGDALYRAGVLPPAPEGYGWTWDYTLAPLYYYF